MGSLPIQLDRDRRTPLAAQIYSAIREGIENGRLASGARLPSWQDLAAQLGVSRGTVRVAYARLIAEQFAIGLGQQELVWLSGSPDPQCLTGRRKPRFCRTSSTSSESTLSRRVCLQRCCGQTC
jgi:DNA-binding transcriptional MocR family regulator